MLWKIQGYQKAPLITTVKFVTDFESQNMSKNVSQRPKHHFSAKLWHKNNVFDEKRCGGVSNIAQRRPETARLTSPENFSNVCYRVCKDRTHTVNDDYHLLKSK